ncbi:hypothetical protein D3C81_1438370 [compost metagenome]
MPSTLLLPPPQTMLKPPLSRGIDGRMPLTWPGDTVTSGTVPGAPNRKLLEPVPKIEVLACFSLLRLTSTKRMSVCTWLIGAVCMVCVSSASARSAVARPSTNSMLLRASALHSVQTLRLVVPACLPVTRKPRVPSNWTSATSGSPTARRWIGSG